jgi:hypothetical protein
LQAQADDGGRRIFIWRDDGPDLYKELATGLMLTRDEVDEVDNKLVIKVIHSGNLPPDVGGGE